MTTNCQPVPTKSQPFVITCQVCGRRRAASSPTARFCSQDCWIAGRGEYRSKRTTNGKPPYVAAFRNAIERQIRGLRLRTLRSPRPEGAPPPCCAHCGRELPSENAQAHHDPPLVVLAQRFLRSRGLDFPDVDIAWGDHAKRSREKDSAKIADLTLRREWQTYHGHHAVVVLVHKGCHGAADKLTHHRTRGAAGT